jgi:Ca2+-binding EF-hand superfamily protein
MLALLLLGCSRSPQVPEPAKAADMPSAPANDSAELKPDVPVDADTETQETDGTSAESAAPASVSAPSPSQAPPEASLAPSPPLKLLVLADQGPIRLDFVVWIEGAPAGQFRDQAIQQLLAAANEGSESRQDWQQFTQSAAFQQGWFGNEPAMTVEQRDQLIYRCDLNRNQQVDPNEIMLSLLPNEASGRLLSLEATTINARGTLRLFDWLDQNGDGRLDSQECQHAAQRLRRLDRNDDGVLDAQELQAESTDAPAGDRPESTVIWMHEETDWSSTLFMIEERYAYGSPVQAADVPGASSLFAAVDHDGDGYWGLDEAPRIAQQPPELTFTTELGTMTTHSTTERYPPPRGTTAMTAAAGGVTLEQLGEDVWQAELPQGRLAISRRAAMPPIWNTPSWARVMEQADGDRDGRLNSEEFADLPPEWLIPFTAADGNGDSAVDDEELRSALARQRLPRRATLRLTVHHAAARPVYTLLDRNGDSRISERELARAPQQLAMLAGETGELREHDFPRPIRLELAQLSDVLDEEFVGSLLGQSNTERPIWFRSLDQNRDGVISRREFPGEAAQFDEADGNADDFLDWEELAQ